MIGIFSWVVSSRFKYIIFYACRDTWCNESCNRGWGLETTDLSRDLVLSVLCLCTMLVLSVNYTCNICELYLFYLFTMLVLSVYYTCTTCILCLYYLCTMFVLFVYYVCTICVLCLYYLMVYYAFTIYCMHYTCTM